MLQSTDATSQYRSQLSGPDQPSFMSSFGVDVDSMGQQATAEIQMPPLLNRQAWNAQDPLASVHHYQVIMYVVIPACFGVRMCLNCPRCNVDATDPNCQQAYIGCADLLGCNNKLAGGFAGIALALAFANEFQGEGTPHGHGFVPLANMYQHNTLQEIAAMLESNALGICPDQLVERVKLFCDHVQRESHFDQAKHEEEAEKLEQGFHSANDEKKDSANVFLSLRPKTFFDSTVQSNNWHMSQASAAQEEAIAFTAAYEADAQFVFSRCQHHWHAKDAQGERVPLPYCRVKGLKVKKHVCCKQNFPRHVTGWIQTP